MGTKNFPTLLRVGEDKMLTKLSSNGCSKHVREHEKLVFDTTSTRQNVNKMLTRTSPQLDKMLTSTSLRVDKMLTKISCRHVVETLRE